jgi:hypothetical protein
MFLNHCICFIESHNYSTMCQNTKYGSNNKLFVSFVLLHSLRSHRNDNTCIICHNLIGEFNLRCRYLKPNTYLFQDKKGIKRPCINQ